MLPRPLPRAPAVWLGIIGGAAALDYWADRGEPDLDTISECCRQFVGKTPGGRHLFAAACIGVPWWFYDHIVSGLDGRIGSQGDPRDAPTPGGLTTT